MGFDDPRMPTDKGESGYVPVYQALAHALPGEANLCELGVYQGGSLQMWRELFPNAQTIIGVDIDPNCRWPRGTIKIVADQQDPTLPQRLNMLVPTGFHLIVDDASHLGHPTYKSFQHLWPLVVPGGFYVIEDWCVGFPTYPNYDDSMVSLAMTLINKFSTPDTDVNFITYRYGMIILSKKLLPAPGRNGT